MATMNYNQIDATYPKSGENNSSQGFRDNFGYIKESLEYVDTAIDDINSLAVKLNKTNTFTTEGILSNVKLQNISEAVLVGDATVTSNITIDYTDGSYQSLILGGDVEITLTGFPQVDGITDKGRFSRLRLEIRSDSSQLRTLNFNPPGSGQIYYKEGWPENLSVSGTNTSSIATTSAVASGGTATIGFAAQASAPYAIGSNVVVEGVTPSIFNGVWIVTGCTTTSVQYALAGTYGPQTVAGTVKGSTNIVLIDFFTRNGGEQIFAHYLGTYAQTAPATLKSSLTVQGKTILGDNFLTDRTIINSVPRLPRLTTLNINDIIAEAGMVVFDTTTNQFKGYNGTSWVVLG